MSNTTIALRSSGATGNVPNALSLAYGEFALNYADGIIYYRTDSDTVGSILTTQPSGLDKEIQFNDLGSFGSSANLSFNKTTGLLSTSRIYVSANAQVVGNVTASKLISNNSIGDSGGELLLAKPAANTILDGLGITIDAFQNKIRFFEQGGTNRGAYIDLTEAAANVGTNLLAGSGGGNNALQYRSSYTANSGQTVFAATYIPGYVDTFINGVKLTPGVDFTATNGTTITLSDGAVANDSVEIIGYVTLVTTLPDVIQHRFSYTANTAQTTFAAVYVAPYVDVYKNGGRLSFGDDFIANNGTDIVLTTGAAQDDLIEIIGYSSYTVTGEQAEQLTTGRTIGMTGDVTWTSSSFNGTANVTGTSTLANTGVTAGTYTKVTVDAKGRVTTGNTLSFSDLPSYSGNLVFTGTGNRITGNFGSGTVDTRIFFQSSSSNTQTNIVAVENGTTSNATGAAQLVVADSAYATGANFVSGGFSLIKNTDLRIASNATGTGTFLPMTFYTSGTEKLRIAADTTGTYTFGGTAPRITGDFSNATAANRVMFQSSTTNGNTIVGAIPNGTGATSVFRASNASDPTNAGQATFGLNATAVVVESGISGTGTYVPMIFATGGSERVRIDTAGNVGIGTNSPANRLDVTAALGVVNVSSSTGTNHVKVQVNNTGGSFQFAIENSAGSNFGAPAYSRVLWNDGAHPTVLYTNSTERVRIDSSGNVGIGTTTTSGYRLTINGSLGATSITETSALALKENLRNIEDPLDKVLQLVGKIYDRKDGSAKNEVGLIADDVIKVIPELVKSDSEGNPDGVHYTRLSVYLLECIKELKQEIDDLRAEK
jgi:hypothetical protein